MSVLKKVMSVFFLSIVSAAAVAHAEVPAVHGMVVFGKGTTYASHLPMFHPPHDRQLILEISLEDLPRSQTLVGYEAAKAAGKILFTLAPEVMDLEPVASGVKTRFSGTLYDGHFERGGKVLGPVIVQIAQVIFSSKLDASADPSGSGKYLVFGSVRGYFAAHLIQGKPSFDAILEVGRPYVLRCVPRSCREPLQIPVPAEELPLALSGPKSLSTLVDALSSGESLQLGDPIGEAVDVRRLIYSEERELAH